MYPHRVPYAHAGNINPFDPWGGFGQRLRQTRLGGQHQMLLNQWQGNLAKAKRAPNSSVVFAAPNRLDEDKKRSQQKELELFLTPAAAIPRPPGWTLNLKNAAKKQYNTALLKVDPKSREHAIIAGMLSGAKVRTIDRIVNPLLWDKFVKKRIDMIKTKTNDLQLLTDIGLSKSSMRMNEQFARGFKLHPKVADVPYNDNMALLFHCTNNQANIDSICASGLDERIGNGGLLGRGIYFSDNVMKSTSYDRCGVIFVFAVLLGDCISLNDSSFKELVREPKKRDEQKRNNNDLFFDSVFAHPLGAHEYVIYDRQQCYPVYKVTYDRSPASPFVGLGNSGKATSSRSPPFCWESTTSGFHLPSFDRAITFDWDFYAEMVFDDMRK